MLWFSFILGSNSISVCFQTNCTNYYNYHTPKLRETKFKPSIKLDPNIDNGFITGAVFLDLNKAFDTVNHKMLLNKLDCLGLNNNTMDWFTFYLSDGEHVTSIGNCLSFPRPVTVGVPQWETVAFNFEAWNDFFAYISSVVKSGQITAKQRPGWILLIREFYTRVYREPLAVICGYPFKHNSIGDGLKKWILVYFSI